ncbi:MAG: arylsulfotransferase family protein [Nocardioides sp.]|uniref:arylsulfotransferase family protein n=1 Tax=Nocardioides sp. TaxID=35761 RepID=UPI0039E3DC59
MPPHDAGDQIPDSARPDSARPDSARPDSARPDSARPDSDDRSADRPRTGGGHATRRTLLVGAGGIALGATGSWAAIHAEDDSADSSSDEGTTPTVLHYRSTAATAAQVTVTRLAPGELDAGLLFATPKLDDVFRGVIYDADGEPVWIAPDGGTATDLRVQTYRGEPVLTYWTGLVATGNGQGRGVILDRSYRQIASVRCGNGLLADLHEFELTDAGTALLTSYPSVSRDLTGIGGPADGWIFDCHVQEIDVATGAVLLDWTASDHIELTESYQEVGDTVTADDPYDAFHINAVSADTDHTLLVSARHTHTVYSLDRDSGRVRWRMGGKRSDFEIADDATFLWQHHARRRSATTFSVFDNHTDSTTGSSRGLVLAADEDAKTVTLSAEYTRSGMVSPTMGSVRPLGGGNVLVGWGYQPVITEFAGDGTALWEVSGLGVSCYRAAKHAWTGTPSTDPDIAVTATEAGGLQVSASWNGATEVAGWRVLGGRSRKRMRQLTTVRRTGFETDIDVDSRPWIRVEALDSDGQVLGRSRAVGAPSA